MRMTFDKDKLATMVRQIRSGRGYREVADEIGTISASTLCRVEKGHYPDLHVFTQLCNWLNVSPATFFIEQSGKDKLVEDSLSPSSQTQLIDLLRSDGTLLPVVANVLVAMITAGYQIRK